MIIKNVSVFSGPELKYIPFTNIKITDQKFQSINLRTKENIKEKSIDCEGLVLIPGLINSHVHIGDSIGKDITLNSSVNSKIHPVLGVKSKILKKTKPSHLSAFMKNTCKSMIQKGITTFIDFREGGLEGVVLIKKILSLVPIKGIILGRVECYQNQLQIKKNIGLSKERKKELAEILQKCDGLGISGANENSNSVLRSYSKSKKIRAIHSAETIQSNRFSKRISNRTETNRALRLNPHFLVHMTHASKVDLISAAKKTRGVVVCPRANAALAEGIPNIVLMQKAGCNIALGTDNVMINSPDMFREMDFLWKVTMGLNKKRIDPKQILKMATVNAGKLLQKKIGVIEKNFTADGVFIDKHAIDLEPMHDPYASIIHRASQSNIKAVMIAGKIVHGKI